MKEKSYICLLLFRFTIGYNPTEFVSWNDLFLSPTVYTETHFFITVNNFDWRFDFTRTHKSISDSEHLLAAKFFPIFNPFVGLVIELSDNIIILNLENKDDKRVLVKKPHTVHIPQRETGYLWQLQELYKSDEPRKLQILSSVNLGGEKTHPPIVRTLSAEAQWIFEGAFRWSGTIFAIINMRTTKILLRISPIVENEKYSLADSLAAVDIQDFNAAFLPSEETIFFVAPKQKALYVSKAAKISELLDEAINFCKNFPIPKKTKLENVFVASLEDYVSSGNSYVCSREKFIPYIKFLVDIGQKFENPKFTSLLPFGLGYDINQTGFIAITNRNTTDVCRFRLKIVDCKPINFKGKLRDGFNRIGIESLSVEALVNYKEAESNKQARLALFECRELKSCVTCEIYGFLQDCGWSKEKRACLKLPRKKTLVPNICHKILSFSQLESPKRYLIVKTTYRFQKKYGDMVFATLNNVMFKVTKFDKTTVKILLIEKIPKTVINISITVKRSSGGLMLMQHSTHTIDKGQQDNLLKFVLYFLITVASIFIIGLVVFFGVGSRRRKRKNTLKTSR